MHEHHEESEAHAAPQPGPMDFFRHRVAFWFTFPIVLAADQAMRGIAQLFLKPAGWQPGDAAPVYPWLDGVVHGTWALGGFSTPASTGPMLWVSVAFGLLFWAAVFYAIGFRSGPKRLVLRLGGGLLLGGLMSNLVDHAIWGGARNFLLLGFKNPFSRLDPDTLMTDAVYAANPSFSPAAACIVVGLMLVLVGAMIGKDKSAPKPVPPPRSGARPKPIRPRVD